MKDNKNPEMKPLRRSLMRVKYLLCDWFCFELAWLFFFGFRKIYEGTGQTPLSEAIFADTNYLFGCLIIPLFWCCICMLQGYYHSIYRKTVFQDLSDTFKTCLIGSILLFFFIILDDRISRYTDYYLYFTILFLSFLIPCFVGRCIITAHTLKQIRQKRIGFNTLLIGSGKEAIELLNSLDKSKRPAGNCFVGYISPSGKEAVLDQELPFLGGVDKISPTLSNLKVEEIYIAIEKGEENSLPLIMSQCISNYLIIKIKPNVQTLLLGAVRRYDIGSQPFIKLSFERPPLWQRFLRRCGEIALCSIAILLLSPLLLYTAYRVRRSSPGPIFYSHERLGLYGKPFYIYKFRSMYLNAEQGTPLLTTQNDNRVTSWGKIIRKYRIDELPQLYNILKGDMALVGPRPERAYFVEQIVKHAPHYRLLFNVKPGLTSWGETQYGYAENIEQMIERLAYDLVYIENPSIWMDMKILLHTIGVVFRGEGK